ncbi:hypothetical protein XELAEV_18005118mg [Xenopus laevis]|uniref:Uncharacterized protein n=1 Tax=Xenopus laevis TaxID=8355 RepID=A0A974DY01_XENLA|nr:hypothetical protein XELAEV_18005118mg [Xenopus laevis]
MFLIMAQGCSALLPNLCAEEILSSNSPFTFTRRRLSPHIHPQETHIHLSLSHSPLGDSLLKFTSPFHIHPRGFIHILPQYPEWRDYCWVTRVCHLPCWYQMNITQRL